MADIKTVYTRLGKISLRVSFLVAILSISFSCRDTNQGKKNSSEYSGLFPGPERTDSVARVFAPGIVSTNNFEFNLIIHPGQKRIYYNIFDKINSRYSVFMVEEVNNIWNRPRKVFSDKYNTVLSAVSPDGNTLFFYSDRPSRFGNGDLLAHSDIWIRQMGKGEPDTLQNIGTPVNTRIRELSLSVSNKNVIYYYSSDSNYKTAIYSSCFSCVSYTTPEKMGSEINDSEDAHNPCIAPDESYIIFTSYRTGGYGDADLYISFHRSDGTWTQAKNMGPEINSSSQDDFATLSPDGNYLFFSTDRDSKGNCDIYWISTNMIKKLKPKD